MADENQSNDSPPKRTLNLQTISQNVLSTLQRHYDILAFNLASRSTNTHQAYVEKVQHSKLLPFPQAHMNFEQIEAFSYDFLQHHFINDMLHISVACMDNCFLLCNLIAHKKELDADPTTTHQNVQAAQQSFIRLPLHEKFSTYETDFGYITDYEDMLICLGQCLQCIAQKNGIVGEEHLKEGVFRFELKKLKDDAEQGIPAEKQLETIEKVFKLNDRIRFAEEELQYITVTLTAFFHELFQFVHNYAQNQQAP